MRGWQDRPGIKLTQRGPEQEQNKYGQTGIKCKHTCDSNIVKY